MTFYGSPTAHREENETGNGRYTTAWTGLDWTGLDLVLGV